MEDLNKTTTEVVRKNCAHKCHNAQPLNKWIEHCSMCGCPKNKLHDSFVDTPKIL